MILAYFKKNVAALFGGLFWTATAVCAVPVPLHVDSWSQIIKSTALVLIIFVIFALLIHKALTCNLADKGDAAKLSRPRLALGGALLCAATWSVYGVVFYPGLVSWDFYVQWHEMAGTIPRTDLHPFFYTSLIWLLTRIWYSPAIIIIAQIVSMSALVGFAVRTLQKIGVSKVIIVGMILFYAFFPLNGFYTASLWKDISYSIVFAWLILLLITVGCSSGKALAQPGMILPLFLALCCVALMRHNGIVPAFSSLLVLFALYHRSQQRKVLLFLSVAAVGTVLLFKGPVLDRLGVERHQSRRLGPVAVPVQNIGAILHDGASLSAEEEQVLSKILPIAHWKGGYNALSAMPLIFGKDAQGRHLFNAAFLQDDAEYRRFLKIWVKLSLRHPLSILRYYVKATELVWRIHSPNGVFVIPDEGVTLYPDKPFRPIKEQVGSLGKLLINLLLEHPSTGWFLCRGGLYFWLNVFFLSLTFVRARNIDVSVVAVPLLLQVATVAAFPMCQDTRYMFPIILTAPVFIALYFSPGFGIPSGAEYTAEESSPFIPTEKKTLEH